MYKQRLYSCIGTLFTLEGQKKQPLKTYQKSNSMYFLLETKHIFYLLT